MPNIPPEDREEWLRQVREKLAREDAEKNKAKGGDGATPNGQDADHAAREDEDNIVQLEQVRARRKMRLAEADEATVDKMVADGQADLAALAARFNAVYAVVNETGKCWVFRWRHDPALDREVLERIRRHDFRDLYANETLTAVILDPKTSKPVSVTKSAADWWWESPARRQFLGGVTFDPIGQVPTSYWNLWRGFRVQPAPGNWNLMREHIENVLCNGVSAHADYVLDWMAAAVQRCNEQGHVALVFRGKEGCGKRHSWPLVR